MTKIIFVDGRREAELELEWGDGKTIFVWDYMSGEKLGQMLAATENYTFENRTMDDQVQLQRGIRTEIRMRCRDDESFRQFTELVGE